MRIFDRPHDLDESDPADKGGEGKSKASTERFAALRSASDSSGDHGASPSAGSPIPTSTAAASHKQERSKGGGGDEASSIRRARHAEVLLADSLVNSHGRMWLRLRWPGAQGGFGGFVALDKNDVDELMRAGIEQASNTLVQYPTSKSMKLLEEYDDGLGEGEEGEAGEVSCSFSRSVSCLGD